MLPEMANRRSDRHPRHPVDFGKFELGRQLASKLAGLDVGAQVIRDLLPQQFAAVMVDPT